MVVARVTVDLVDGDVELVGPFDEVEAVDREDRIGVAENPLGLQVLEVSVGPNSTRPRR